MDRTTALVLLGLDSDSGFDQIEIAIEEAIFSEASFFMRRTFIPKLADARIKKLTNIASAAAEIGVPFPEPKAEDLHSADLVIFESEDFIELLSIYNRLETKLKLEIINSENPFELKNLYQYWRKCFLDYRIKYIDLFENLAIPNLDRLHEEVSVTSPLDFNELIDEIKKGIYDGTVYKEYGRLLKMSY